MVGRNVVLNIIIFTMVFSGGIIPTYLVVKSLGLLNTYWAVMLPVAINAFNLIVVKSFFQEIPNELIESARIDGVTILACCGELFYRSLNQLSQHSLFSTPLPIGTIFLML